MDIFHSLAGARIIFVLGIVNLVSGILILLTCRCAGASRIMSPLMHSPSFKRIYSLHCYIWWIFWISVIIHAIFAIGLAGIPF